MMMIMIFIYTAQIQCTKFSHVPSKSKSFQFLILYNSQIKSNVGFGGEGKTGVPEEKHHGAE